MRYGITTFILAIVVTQRMWLCGEGVANLNSWLRIQLLLAFLQQQQTTFFSFKDYPRVYSPVHNTPSHSPRILCLDVCKCNFLSSLSKKSENFLLLFRLYLLAKKIGKKKRFSSRSFPIFLIAYFSLLISSTLSFGKKESFLTPFLSSHSNREANDQCVLGKERRKNVSNLICYFFFRRCSGNNLDIPKSITNFLFFRDYF